jgi:hypothetical protein
MNFSRLEFKLLWKSRLTWIVGIVTLLLSVLYAFAIVKYSANSTYTDQNGKAVTLTGLDAIHENQKLYKPFEGKITDQVLRNDLKAYQTISKKYNGAIPDDIYVKDLIPRISRLYELAALYRGDSSDLSVLSGLSPKQVTDFYGKRTEHLQEALAKNYPNSPSARQEALSLNSKIKTPFTYEYGISQNTISSVSLMIFIVVLVCVVINGSVFSSGYQNGADAVLRTTKNGRRKLALSKLGASLVTDGVLYVVCIAAYTLIVNIAFDWRGLSTSEQANEIWSIAPLNFGQKEIVLIVAGFITLMAVACFTMFLSSVCPTPISSLIMGIGFCVLPSIIWSIAQGDAGNPAALICNFFPAGGVGFGNSLSFQLDKIMFLTIGPFSIWGPFLAIGAALIEIPVFFLLAIHAYCRHQAA